MMNLKGSVSQTIPLPVNGFNPSIRFGQDSAEKSTALPVAPIDTTAMSDSLKSRTKVGEKAKPKEHPTGTKFFRAIFATLFGISGLLGGVIYRDSSQNLQKFKQAAPSGEKLELETRMERNKLNVWWPLIDLKENANKLHQELKSAYSPRAKVDTIHQYMLQGQEIQKLLEGIRGELFNSSDVADFELANKLRESYKDIYGYSSFHFRENTQSVKLVEDVVRMVRANGSGPLMNPIQAFVQARPEFAALSDADKDHLSEGILSVALQNSSLSNPDERDYGYSNSFATRLEKKDSPESKLYSLVAYYRGEYFKYPVAFNAPNFADYLGNDVVGLRSVAEYNKFLESFIRHPENFKNLSPEEKTRLLEKTGEMMKVVDYPFYAEPNSYDVRKQKVLYLMGIVLMLASGVGGLSLLEGTRLMQRLGRKLGKKQQLHIITQEKDKDKIQTLEKQIEKMCDDLHRIRNNAIQKSPEVQAFFQSLYGTFQLETDMTAIKFQLAHRTTQELLPDDQDRSIDAAAYLQKVLDRAEKALAEKDYLTEGFLEDETVLDPGTLPPNASASDRLDQEIHQLENIRNHTYCAYINQQMISIEAADQASFQQGNVEKLERQVQQEPENSGLSPQLMLEKRKLQTLQTLAATEEKKVDTLRASLKNLEEKKLALQMMHLEVKELVDLGKAQSHQPGLKHLGTDPAQSALLEDIKLRLEGRDLLRSLEQAEHHVSE